MENRQTIYVMFYLINLIGFCKNMLIQNLMPATHFNQVGTGATKDWERCGMLHKHLIVIDDSDKFTFSPDDTA